MSALKWIVKEAKAIKKQYPKRFAKWTDYVAQASAIYAKKHKGVSPVGKKKAVKKKATKKAVGKVVKKKAIKKTVTKKAVKKVVRRKPNVSMHKDTKSHNVNIRVMSGINKNFKKFIQYKKHIIDVTQTESGKKMYHASTKLLLPPFITNQLSIAKKFIDRQIAIDKIKKHK